MPTPCHTVIFVRLALRVQELAENFWPKDSKIILLAERIIAVRSHRKLPRPAHALLARLCTSVTMPLRGIDMFGNTPRT